MGREDRYWERAPREDTGHISESAAAAAGFIFLAFQGGSILVLGIPLGLVVGLPLGAIAIVVVTRLIISNRKPVREPPRDLL